MAEKSKDETVNNTTEIARLKETREKNTKRKSCIIYTEDAPKAPPIAPVNSSVNAIDDIGAYWAVLV